MNMSGAYVTSIMPSRSSRSYSQIAAGRRLEEQRPVPHDRLHAAHLLVDEPQRHRVLVHDVVEEVAAGALGVEAPRVARGIEVGLELVVGAADDGLDAHHGRRADGARRR